MKNDWKVFRIGKRKTHELHRKDGKEHIYDYDENRMLTESEIKVFLCTERNLYEKQSDSLKRR